MATITDFARRHRIRAESEMVGENPHNPDWQDAYHYKVTLRCKRRRMTVYFSMGYAHTDEPKADDVLDCLASDSASIENAGSFEEWAPDLGYDPDSRKAERIYRACCQQAEKLKRFLGPELYHELLHETDGL